MNNKIQLENMDGLCATLLIPLWAKAAEYHRADALLRDEQAVRLRECIDYDFNRFAGARASQAGCCARAALIDDAARTFLQQYPDAVVVQLGAGLDARFERLGALTPSAWYDLDLPAVIAFRRRLLPENGNHYLAASLFDDDWLDTITAHRRPILLLAEGVLCYFSETQVRTWLIRLVNRLPQAALVFDTVPPAMLGRAKRHDALKHLEQDPPEFKWALADAAAVCRWHPALCLHHTTGLSRVCGHRYPWPLRLLYKSAWGRRLADPQVVRIDWGLPPPAP